MKTRGLATQLIFFILTGAIIIFAAIFTYNYQVSKASLRAKVRENARSLTQETVYKIEAILRGAEKVPLNLAATLEHFPYEEKELPGLVRSALEHNQELYGICVAYGPYASNPQVQYFAPYFFRDHGHIASTWLGSESYQYFYLDWYQIPKELNSPVWSEPYYDEGAGNAIMSTFSLPFFQEKGGPRKMYGVIGADISLMWLKDIVSQVRILQSGYAFLISRNGVFVTHPDPRVIMRESIFSLAEARKAPRLREIGRDMVQGKEGFVHGTDFATGKRAWLYYAPVPSSGWSLGVVFPEDELFAEVVGLLRRNVLIALVGLLFLAATITAVSRTITRPLRGLARKTADIAQGDFTATVPETGAKEIVHLARSFNSLGQQLTEYIEKRDFIRDTFGRYLTQEVVKKLLESREALELGGETREVSILMSDLRGFTALTAEMPPEEVITFLNRYLGKMIEILMDYRATIDEIIGDGILAFFGAPEDLADHPARAVACALKMQTAMEEINALNAAEGLPHLEMGIAVNTGEVVVGNIGSEKRTKYSVVGAQVNFASRLESYAVGGQVLISPATYARVGDLVEVGKTLQAEMKGVRGTTTVYEVRGIRGPYEVHLTAKSETLIPLSQRLNARLFRIADKIVTGAPEPCVITHLGESAVVIACQGELSLWEDVRLVLLDEGLAELPGKIYGKVTAITPAGGELNEVHLHFTSVSPELYRLIHQAAGEGTGTPPGDEVGET